MPGYLICQKFAYICGEADLRAAEMKYLEGREKVSEESKTRAWQNDRMKGWDRASQAPEGARLRRRHSGNCECRSTGSYKSNCVNGHEKRRMTHGYRQDADRSTAEGL